MFGVADARDGTMKVEACRGPSNPGKDASLSINHHDRPTTSPLCPMRHNVQPVLL